MFVQARYKFRCVSPSDLRWCVARKILSRCTRGAGRDTSRRASKGQRAFDDRVAERDRLGEEEECKRGKQNLWGINCRWGRAIAEKCYSWRREMNEPTSITASTYLRPTSDHVGEQWLDNSYSHIHIEDYYAVCLAFEFILSFAVGFMVISLIPITSHSAIQQGFSAITEATLFSGALVAFNLTKQRCVHCALNSTRFAAGSAIADGLKATAVLVVALLFIRTSDALPRSSIALQAIFVTGFVAIGRSLWGLWARTRLVEGRLVTKRVVLLGERERLSSLRRSKEFFNRLKGDGVCVVAVNAWPAGCSKSFKRGLVNSLIAWSRSGSASAPFDGVVLLPSTSNEVVEFVVDALAETPLTAYVVPTASRDSVRHAADNQCRIGGLPAIAIANSPLIGLGASLKRGFDVMCSAFLLFLLLPLFICVALAIGSETKGPIFFRQTRHGYGNRQFKVFKFRSMRVMEDGAAFRQATRSDPRITSVGNFIRRTNIDELPQLINVLIGDMSLVGPRPHPVALNEDFAGRIRYFHRRHNIRPGITGWAQVNGHRGETDTLEKMERRIAHDLWYIDHWSFELDLRILFGTVFSPVAYRNAG